MPWAAESATPQLATMRCKNRRPNAPHIFSMPEGMQMRSVRARLSRLRKGSHLQTVGELRVAAQEKHQQQNGGGCGTDPHEDHAYKTNMDCWSCGYHRLYWGKWNDGGVYECPLCHEMNFHPGTCYLMD